jgi:peptide-methionine (S)-S-oxide reductase
MFGLFCKTQMPTARTALPGRSSSNRIWEPHFLNGRRLDGPFPEGAEHALFGMGCFWGVERQFWSVPGVWVTSVGYAGGFTSNPTYEEVCTGRTGHNEVVRVTFDPEAVGYAALLKIFWEGHDPTQGMRQGNDIGTQYRSGIYCSTAQQQESAEAAKMVFQNKLSEVGFGTITTEITPIPDYYLAENYHQQYLAKNPGGYCGVGGIGVTCPIGMDAK